MSKYNQKTETDRLYNHFNSHEYRVERIKDVLDELKSIKDVDVFFNSLGMHIGNLKKELNAKKYLNSMWYCHD